MAAHKVFYSWQSDSTSKTGPSTNRYFILEALESAAKAIREDDSVEVEPVVDRDTLGVAGSPNIADTILRKIDEASVFVCDVSIINPESPDRKTPNPNVLLELGYALKALPLGINQVVLVMNTASGSPEQLPFDLRQYRITTYSAPKQTESEKGERASQRKKLQESLNEALRLILHLVDKQRQPAKVSEISLAEQARLAVEAGQPNQAGLVRRAMRSIVEQIQSLAPDLGRCKPEEMDELLVAAFAKTNPLVTDFGRLTHAIAISGAQEPAEVILKGFGPIFEGYDLPSGFSGHSRNLQFDFHKFLGHELFVTFASSMIQEDRWEMLGGLLRQGIFVNNAGRGEAALVTFEYASQPVQLLEYRNERLKLNKANLHAHILSERHAEGDLGKVTPIKQFQEADLFLSFFSVLTQEVPDQWNRWYTRSVIYLRDKPRFLVEAQSQRFALRLARSIGLGAVAALRQRFAERASALCGGMSRSHHYIDPFQGVTAEQLGSMH